MKHSFSTNLSNVYPVSRAGRRKRGIGYIPGLLILAVACTWLSLPATQAAGPDGTLDLTFQTGKGAGNQIGAVAVQSDGKILIGGVFTNYNGITINRIARLNPDGSLDSSFNPGSGADNAINTIVVQSDGKILIGGGFTTYNGVTRNRIARLNTNGSLDSSFNSNINNSVDTIAVQSDGKILAGGNFSQAIIRLNSNGAWDFTFNTGSGASGIVQTIAVQSDGKIIIGGFFTSYNGTNLNNIARLNTDGSLDSSFNSGGGFDGLVLAIASQNDSKILVAGQFANYNGTARNNIARLNSDGSLDSSFNPGSGTNSAINAMTLQSDGKIIIGGFFSNYNGTTRLYVARVNSNGSLDTSFSPQFGANNIVNDLALQSDGKVLIGGFFTSYNGTMAHYLARANADGTADTNFNPGGGANGSLSTVAVQSDGKILLAGGFSTYNGSVANRVARLNPDSTLDTSFNSGTGANSSVNILALQSDGKVLIGGFFTSYNGTAINRIARLNPDGSLDSSFNPGTGANNSVSAIRLQNDGKILIGGNFSSYNGTVANRIARLNPDGSLDSSFNPGTGADGAIFAVGRQGDGKILIGGSFANYNGTVANRIARLNPDGSLDTSFNSGSGANNSVVAIEVQSGGKILIGGYFTNYNGTSANRIVRLNPDSSLDASFNPGSAANDTINTIVAQSDGKILIGGNFTTYNGTTSNRTARLNPDGSLDTGFNPGSGANAAVNTIALQSDDKVLIGGSFNGVAGYPRDFIARLENTVKKPSSLTLTSNPNPAEPGQNVVFTATITPLTAAGTVTFTLGTGGSSTVVTATLTGGTASYVTSTLPLGDTPVQVSYEGSANFFASSSPVYTQTINKIATSLTVSSSPNPSPFGQAATFTATLLPTAATGTVTFTIGAHNVTAALTNGVATYVTNTLASGNYLVSAEYEGSPTYSSTATAGQYTHVVSPPLPGSIQWQQGSYTVSEGPGTAIFTATRSGGSDGAASVTVVITNGTAAAADYTAPIDLTLNWANGESGSKTLSFTIVDDEQGELSETFTLGLANPLGDFGVTVSSPAETVVTITDNDKFNTTTTLSSTPNPAVFGQAVSFTATVTANPPASTPPGSGVVTFTFDGVTNVVVALTGEGVASYITDTLAAGSHAVSASYGGNSQYHASATLSPLSQVVSKIATSLGLTSNVSPVVAGANLIFTATVQPLAASGLVTFTFNGLTSTTSPLVNGTASYVTNTLPAGTYTVTATYGGDNTHASSTAQPYTQVIIPACNPLVVTNSQDDGQATTCGTFSYALLTASSGTTITFELANLGNSITFMGSLTPTLKAGIAVNGGANGVVLNGNGVAGDGLRLGGGNTLTKLTIKNFAGRELLVVAGTAANRLDHIIVQS